MGIARTSARWRAHPMLGIGFTAYQKLCRLAGVDHLHVGGFNSKFYESNEEVAQLDQRLPDAAVRRTIA